MEVSRENHRTAAAAAVTLWARGARQQADHVALRGAVAVPVVTRARALRQRVVAPQQHLVSFQQFSPPPHLATSSLNLSACSLWVANTRLTPLSLNFLDVRISGRANGCAEAQTSRA
jgi:hypothetical protein